MIINDETLALIMRWEGLVLTAYQDVAGVWTIGYGHSERAPLPPKPYYGMTITADEAERILAQDLEHFASQIRPLFKRTPTPNQFGAMLSLAFNIGVGAFAKSTCLRRFNEGNVEGAAEALTWFNKAGGRKVQGLVNRRADEKKLFLTDWVDRAIPDGETAPRTKAQSRTLQMSTASIFSGVASVWSSITMLDGTSQLVAMGLGAVVILAGAIVFKERLKKWANGDD